MPVYSLAGQPSIHTQADTVKMKDLWLSSDWSIAYL